MGDALQNLQITSAWPSLPSSSNVMEINLKALIENWQSLSIYAGMKAADCAAVVKANAYGLGAVKVVRALAKHGCTIFFTATLAEALLLRQNFDDITLYVFEGRSLDTDHLFAHYNLCPVLNSLEDLQQWRDFCVGYGSVLPLTSALHIDTGINRLGIEIERLTWLQKTGQTELLNQAGVQLLMTHLACAALPEHPANKQQLQRFKDICQYWPHIRRSMANSCGVFLGPEFHMELLRPGAALYGGILHPAIQNVITFRARILQIRTVLPGEPVGYGGMWHPVKTTKIAVVGAGYADGFPRQASGHMRGLLGEHIVKSVGRISMDMMLFDISHIPDAEINVGQYVTLLGNNQICSLYELAKQAGTIEYEILIALGRRSLTEYLEA